MTTETIVPPVKRRHRRWPWLLLIPVAAGWTVGGLLLAHGGTPVTAACQRATAAQNAYVDEAVAMGYPDVSIALGLQIIAADLKLLNNMTTAGCSPHTLIKVLPDAG